LAILGSRPAVLAPADAVASYSGMKCRCFDVAKQNAAQVTLGGVLFRHEEES
jgi:hypothetical protein